MKSLIRRKLTILINSCDAYSDVWPFFFSALNEYWPHRELQAVLNTEHKKPKLGENFIVNNFKGNGSWGLRLKESLKKINTDYVLCVYDDFILEDFIDESELSKILLKMDSDRDIAVVYLINLGLETKKNTSLMCDREKGNKYGLLEDQVNYRLNSAPAIWRRMDLLHYTGEFDNPWAWEAFGTYRTFGDKKKFYCPLEKEEAIYKYNGKKGGAIYRGKWVKEVVFDKAKKYKINTDFSIRGFSSETKFEKRTLSWKINFILLGYKMIGFRILKFLKNELKRKFIKTSQFKRED